MPIVLLATLTPPFPNDDVRSGSRCSATFNYTSVEHACADRATALAPGPQANHAHMLPLLKCFRNHMKYHHGKGETIRAKKLQVEIGKPKVMRIDVAAAQESGSAIAM